MKSITVGSFFNENRERLSLELIGGKGGILNVIISPELNRPGLALAGFVDLFTYNRAQLLGNTEMLYLETLPKKRRVEAFEIICQFDLPCILLTNGLKAPEELIDICNVKKIPLITSLLTTTQFVHLFSYYLEDIFAPSTIMHGTLVDVYGMGLLFVGRPGIGKSEIALDLIERGHRLVADDIIYIIRKSRGIIVGTANEMTRSFIEIRGVGIVDVQKMFGIRATRVLKRIEIEDLPRVKASDIHELVKAAGARNFVLLMQLYNIAALERKESRIFHFREDFPYTDDLLWRKWVLLQSDGNGGVKVKIEPVPLGCSAIIPDKLTRKPAPVAYSLEAV